MLQKVGREWSAGHFIKRSQGKNFVLFVLFCQVRGPKTCSHGLAQSSRK